MNESILNKNDIEPVHHVLIDMFLGKVVSNDKLYKQLTSADAAGMMP